jgi:hypothetical protein
MFLGIDQMREHVIFHDLGHESRHGAACAGDEVHDLLAPCLIRKSAFDALNLSSQSANARQQLFLIANRVAHAGYYGIPTYPIPVRVVGLSGGKEKSVICMKTLCGSHRDAVKQAMSSPFCEKVPCRVFGASYWRYR